MKSLKVLKPFTGILLLMILVTIACNAGSALPTLMPPTAASGGGSANSTQTAPQDTQAAPSGGEHGTPAEAQSMLQAAVQDYETSGREQALKDFNENKPPFGSNDLYVVCLGTDHKMTANGQYPMLVGLSADSIKDTDGKALGQAVWDVVAVQPQGSMPFHWDNPITGQPESKVLFYQKLDQDVCGVAANNP